MRVILLLTLFLLSVPLVTHADSNSIVNLNSSTATPDPNAATPDLTAVTAVPVATVAPTKNPVTGASPLAGVAIIAALGMVGYLYALQRRPTQ